MFVRRTPTGYWTKEWKVVEAKPEHAADVLMSLEGLGYDVRAITPGSSKHGLSVVHIFARYVQSGDTERAAPPVERAGTYTPDCGCEPRNMAPGATLGPCERCFRTVRWSFSPIQPQNG